MGDDAERLRASIFDFFFLLRRSSDIKKNPYETCYSKFFDVQLDVGGVNATRMLSDLLTRV